MPWLSPGSYTGSTRITLEQGDNLFIAAQVAVSIPLSRGFDALSTGSRVVILGTVAADFGGIMGLDFATSFGSRLDIGATGRLQSFDNEAFSFVGAGLVDNAGTISSFGSLGIAARSNGNSVGSQITNSGLIEGATEAILVEGDANTPMFLLNSGILRGQIAYVDVSVTDHVDTITNTGSIFGDVSLGLGDDMFDGRLGNLQGTLSGGAGNDRLYTGKGEQLIQGGDGLDTMIGGAGADTFEGGLGFDYVSFASAAAGVTANLVTGGTRGEASGDDYTYLDSTSIEGFLGSAFADNLTGNNLGNRLYAGAGNDTLAGGLGIDSLQGQAGQDTFVFNTVANTTTNFDRILDYVVADDSIRLDDAVFAGIGPVGALAAAAFRVNTTGLAGDSSDRIIYNSANGTLYFDFNGTAAGGSIRVAILPTGLAMTAAEFTVF